ncbi:hypothetical protein [Terrabacter sp. Root85]|uniref:hypothetical protein n=1 Tax=Terrabacter sp. Root85 TaxID=1736603 RepID=UPI000A558946|nr:hypothetical protein [Terrabacter sp. Root85]
MPKARLRRSEAWDPTRSTKRWGRFNHRRIGRLIRYSDRIGEITGYAIWAPAYRPEFEVDAGAAAQALDVVIGSDPSGLCAISPGTFPGSAHGEWGIWVPEQLHPAFETELAKHGHDVVDG